MKTLVFGSCNLDIFFSVGHIVGPGETIAAENVTQKIGGKGLNQATALSRAGVDTCIAGNIGADGNELIEHLRKNNVDVSMLETCELPTGKAYIQLNDSGENSIIIYHGANYCVTKEQADRTLDGFSENDVIILQNEINELDYIIEKAFKKKMKVVLNPSPFEEKLRQIDLDMISLLMVNETECRQISGNLDPQDFITETQKKHPSLACVITLGAKGSIYFDGERQFFQPAFKAKAVDTTGAGDTFTGYFIKEYFSSFDAEKALLIASKAAAVTVSRLGAAESIPFLDELDIQ